jgi:hypothetical protein
LRTKVQVLAEFTLHALQVPRLVREVALLVAPLGLGHRRPILVEHRLQVADLLGRASVFRRPRVANSFSIFACARLAGVASRNSARC